MNIDAIIPPMSADTLKKEKILVIESDQSFQDKIVNALAQNGYTVIPSGTGAEGLKKLFDTLPHLVVVDAALSDMTGYDVLAKKVSEPALSKIPVFLTSTQNTSIEMNRVPEGSVAEFLAALYSNPTDIVDKVNRLFNHAALTDEPRETSASGGEKKKILWVEDDKLIGSILSKKLISSGFELTHAKNGEQALEDLKNMVPDVIVLDLLLPGMSGFDILQHIRMLGGGLEKVPVMILSNLSKESDIEKAKKLGARKFLVKAAASLDQIVSEIQGLCG